MPHIGVLFEVRRVETRPGEAVSVVGSRPELGNWDPFWAASGLSMRTGATQYPCWAMPAPVWIELGDHTHRGFSMDEVDSHESASPVLGASSPKVLEFASETPRTPLVEKDGRAASSSARAADEVPAEGAGASAASRGFVRLEYKYVKDRQQVREGGPSIQWEDCIANRKVVLPEEHGSIWIVSDECWNNSIEPTVTRTSLAEVLSRREHLDPEWTSISSKDMTAPEWSEMFHQVAHSPGEFSNSSRGGSSSHHTTSTVPLFC